MLELRPICEHCERALPPESTEARICSFECTFCRACVENLLANVCPTAECGSFRARSGREPIGMTTIFWGNTRRGPNDVIGPVDWEHHGRLAERLISVAPELR